jgi:dihydrofolate reductase
MQNSTSLVRIFLATSLDGFIAGPDDDLSWLPMPTTEGEDFGYAEHMATIGCLLFGRRTYDVVQGMGEQWTYPATMPMLIATRRPLGPAAPQIRAVSGTIEELIAEARAAAGDKDVYLDGGDLIRQALDAGLVDHMTITLVPQILGAGIPLFAGCQKRHGLQLESSRPLEGGMLQLVYRLAKPVSDRR